MFKVNNKTLKRRQWRRKWRRSGIFIVNLENISYLALVNFEQVNAGWELSMYVCNESIFNAAALSYYKILK